MDKVTELNQAYYNQLYNHKSPLLHLLHARVSFDQQSKSRPNHAVLRPFLKRMIRERNSVKVLDYGSGWGVLLLAMPKYPVEAYCFDISANAVKSLKSAMQFLGRRVSEICFDSNNNILPGDFDFIVCSHVLEHVESDDALLRQLVEALRPGGYLLANVPVNEVWNDPKHARSYDRESLRKLITNVGLEILEEQQVDKWSGFFLKYEMVNHSRVAVRRALRLVRGLLALLPYGIVQLSESILLRHQQPQQLLILGRKKNG